MQVKEHVYAKHQVALDSVECIVSGKGGISRGTLASVGAAAKVSTSRSLYDLCPGAKVPSIRCNYCCEFLRCLLSVRVWGTMHCCRAIIQSGSATGTCGS